MENTRLRLDEQKTPDSASRVGYVHADTADMRALSIANAGAETMKSE
jgi:hypothetical protein